jgi:phage major head subunit gpT-like protein
MISGNVPKHLVVGARTGFLSAMRAAPAQYPRVATVINMGSKRVDLVDLGAAPMPKNSRTGVTVQDMIERTLQIEAAEWDITVWVSRNSIEDDQTGTLERKVRSAGQNFPRHMDQRVFKVLNAGDGTTYGSCYNGNSFFNNSHIDAGAAYQTAQDNLYGLSLSLDNFETVRVAAMQLRDDQGEFVGYQHNLIICHPSNEREAAQIANNPDAYDTTNRELNPYAGRIDYILTPEFDTTAWVLAAEDEPIKPIIIALREDPFLQDTWFDPEQPDGGRYYFKFYARYEMYYGDWRTALMGNS